MLDENQLAEYCVQRDLTPAARQVIDQVRSARPSRRVRSGIKNVPCRFASQKMRCIIQAESHRNELPTIVGWEYDSNAFEFYDQPPRIKLTYRGSNGRRRAHLMTPDFFLLADDFTGWVECKTEEWLKARAAEGSTLYVPDGPGRWRCPPGEEYAASVGLAFRVRSSIETNWTAVRNAEFLSDYLVDGVPPATPEQIARAADLLGSQAWVLLKDLIEADPSLPADAIFTMIVHGQLYVDLARDLVTEPERTRVFRDANAAKVYRANIESSQLPAVPDLQTVKVERGGSLLWDGRLMRILNVGDNDIFIEDEARAIIPLQRKELNRLVRAGTIRGLPQDSTAQWAEAEQILRHTSPSGFDGALKRYYSLFPEKAGKGCAQLPAGKERTLRKWRALYRRSSESTGSGLIGLLPRGHLRGNRQRKLDAEVIKIMNEVIDDLYAKSQKRTLVSCWGEVILRCGETYSAPSEKTFRREVRRRRGHDLTTAREGEKAAYDSEEFQWYLGRTGPRHGERPFEIAHIDHTELDIQFVGSRHGENLGKAWLTVMIDAFTRLILAWVLSFEEPSYRSCMSVIRDCIRRHGRIAKTIVVDNGSEFDSIYFETLVARLESHKKSRPGGKPRYGSIVERHFGITNKSFVHNLLGNNQALQNPRRMSKTHDPRRLAVWTLPAFTDAFEGYLDRVYHEAEHSAIGMTPRQAMESGIALFGTREHTLIPYTPAFVVMCLPSTREGTAKVQPGRGVKINTFYYWTEAFRNPAFVGKTVPVRYDPDDVSLAFAWLADHWAPCRSEHAAEFQGRSEKEIRMATQELRARIKRNGERRAVNATLTASYLRSTDVTEKILTQQKRHRESVAAKDHDLQSMLGIPKPNPQPSAGKTAWTDLPNTFYGEFK